MVETLPSGVSSANGTDWSCNGVSGTVICGQVWLLTRTILLLLMVPAPADEMSNQALVSSVTAESDTTR